MDRVRPDRQLSQNTTAPSPLPHQPAFPPPVAQPQIQIPFSDPFHTNRDPFLAGSQARRESSGFGPRLWPPPQGNGHSHSHPHHHLSPSQQPSHTHPPPPPSNGYGAMSLPYDGRRSSLGGARSPPQFPRGPPEPSVTPVYPSRNMPPPSPPQIPPPSIQMGSAPRGPPTVSPFPGVRELANHRPAMPLSNMLGAEDRNPISSPRSVGAAPAATSRSMQPPSPGRARSSSMREHQTHSFREASPMRSIYNDPIREGLEPRRDNVFGSPQHRREHSHSFRAFQPPPYEHAPGTSSYAAPGRPSSQPVELSAPRRVEEMMHREAPPEARIPVFRPLETSNRFPRNDGPLPHDRAPYQNGFLPHAQESHHNSPQVDREPRSQGPMRVYSGSFNTPLREEASPLFRPVHQQTSHPTSEPARESIEGRAQDMRRQLSRHSPPPSDTAMYERGRHDQLERPMTFEEHQRFEMMNRDAYRKESEGSIHRAILNISPELSRKGRNSPLPQAVQGAQPRHVGPGGDNPGIKMEFGRMFPGLGSGVGSATPHAGQSMNGALTPSRMSSPVRHLESGDLVRTAVAELDEERNDSKTGPRNGKKHARRSKGDAERIDGDGRGTPDVRGSKRAKTAHHHHHHVHPHHHHHHHHEPAEATPSSFSMLRFPSNPGSSSHHHHHHHHPHNGHHHHHPPRAVPTPRMPSVTVHNQKVIDACAGQPRKHLGSQLYTTQLSQPPVADISADDRIKFNSKSNPIPVYEGRENCTFTVRVPRYYLASGEGKLDGQYSLEEICRRRQLWGSEIYTDDSDVVAAAVHSGWLQGDFGKHNEDLHDVDDNAPTANGADDGLSLSLDERPSRPVKVPLGHDAHITLLILPPLESYASSHRHHIRSREWKTMHDGMSFMIHHIEFVDEDVTNRFTERGAAGRKKRLAAEEARRRDAAAGLLVMFANGAEATAEATAGAVPVGA